MARENCDVVVVMFNNGVYKILQAELERLCPDADGQKSASMLDLSGPDLDWVRLSEGLGVEASLAQDCAELCDQMQSAIKGKGPRFIEVRV